ncbi:MAG: dihydroorotase [Clostridiales bacterium]|nr:dihydroorotase [Candidatus Blautia equi]
MLIIKNARIVDPASATDMVGDISIEKGLIAEIGEKIEAKAGDQVIDAAGLVAAPGLVDTHVHFRDPGLTYKEDIYTGAGAAAAGGFTTVVCMANTKPVADNVDTISHIMNKAKKAKIHVNTAAAVTTGFDGENITDFGALLKAGALGFTDDGIPIKNAETVKKAMEIAAMYDVPISLHEEDPALIDRQGVNKGRVSEILNYGGASSESEYTLVERDCALALETKARTVIQHISAKESVEIVRKYWRRGARIYGEVTPQHFSLTEDIVLEKGSLARVNPPIRTEEDRQAIIEGLKDGTLNIIATDHAPHSREEKAKDIKDAPSGMIGLETSLALGITNLVRPGHLSLIDLLEKMTINPAMLYNLNCGRIAEGMAADLVLFDPEEKWTVQDAFYSKANNSPFIGMELYGKVKYTICGGRIVFE